MLKDGANQAVHQDDSDYAGGNQDSFASSGGPRQNDVDSSRTEGDTPPSRETQPDPQSVQGREADRHGEQRPKAQ